MILHYLPNPNFISSPQYHFHHKGSNKIVLIIRPYLIHSIRPKNLQCTIDPNHLQLIIFRFNLVIHYNLHNVSI
jgi:hypothetical protein